MEYNRGRLVAALFLIVIGAWFLAIELSPALRDFAYGRNSWPWLIIGLGGLFFLAALLAWRPALLIPGSIVTGIGGMLYYQNLTNNWESWAYSWTLIPGFVGVGLILYGLLDRRQGAVTGGLWNLFSSLVLFGIFASTLGRLQIANALWPVAIILLGLFLLVRAFMRSSREV
ncbi:MAG TPA: hypothetical protein VMS73_04445 [Anaerolineaceae bacterium]|nr:hypothetical protein [Anaerolineaceae bacterium]